MMITLRVHVSILTGASGPGDQGLAAVAYREDRWCLDVVPFLAGERVDSVTIEAQEKAGEP
jgi:hypothetical protein